MYLPFLYQRWLEVNGRPTGDLEQPALTQMALNDLKMAGRNSLLEYYDGCPQKTIIVLLDGTCHNEDTDSNVARFRHAFQLSDKENKVQTRPYYIDGCGTSGNRLGQTSRAMSGNEMPAKVLQAYTAICQDFKNPNDKILLIGFSRGASEARCVTRFIEDFGVLRRSPRTGERNDREYRQTLKKYFERWYNQFWTSGRLKDSKISPEGKDASSLLTNVEVFACVLFDTVSTKHTAPWISDPSFQHINDWPCGNIRNAYQAIALNEHRGLFKNEIMVTEPDDGRSKFTNLKQCWFTGFHSDVGGRGLGAGEMEDDYMSLIPLMWAVAQLDQIGVSFDFAELTKDLNARHPPERGINRPEFRRVSTANSMSGLSEYGQLAIGGPVQLHDDAQDKKYWFSPDALRTPGQKFVNDPSGKVKKIPLDSRLTRESIHWTVRLFEKRHILGRHFKCLPERAAFQKQNGKFWQLHIPVTGRSAITVPEEMHNALEDHLLYLAYKSIYEGKIRVTIQQTLASGAPKIGKQDAIVRNVLYFVTPIEAPVAHNECPIAQAVVQEVEPAINPEIKEGLSRRGSMQSLSSLETDDSASTNSSSRLSGQRGTPGLVVPQRLPYHYPRNATNPNALATSDSTPIYTKNDPRISQVPRGTQALLRPNFTKGVSSPTSQSRKESPRSYKTPGIRYNEPEFSDIKTLLKYVSDSDDRYWRHARKLPDATTYEIDE